MSPGASLVSHPEADDRSPLDVAVIADRLGWEERSILDAARREGARAAWLDDGDLCCGSREDLPEAAAYLIRSRSYVRGPLIAETVAGGDDGDGSVINSAEAISTCSNKVTTLSTLRRSGIATIPYRLVLSRRDVASALDVLGSPIVLKPVFGGLGRRVLLVRELALADSIYDYVEHYGQGFDRALIAQPYLDGATDVRVLAIDARPVAAIERTPAGDWRANVELGAAAEQTEVDDRIRTITADVGGRIGARIFGLDLFDRDGALVVGEVNHAPMFRGLVEATGLDVGHLIASHALGTRVR